MFHVESLQVWNEFEDSHGYGTEGVVGQGQRLEVIQTEESCEIEYKLIVDCKGAP